MEEERRSRFKPVSVESNQSVIDDAVSKVGSSKPERSGYLSIKEGKNIFRIAPPHEEGNPSLEPMCRVFLPREVTVDGKKVVKNYPIFNSKVHSPINRDLVEEYVSFARKTLYKEYSKDEAKLRMSPITGYRDRDKKWISGIIPSVSFVAYAWCGGEFGRLDLSKLIVDRMNDLSIDEESDEAITVDPFSDPDHGVSLIVTYNKSEESQKRYKVSKGSKETALTEAQEDELMEAQPLAEIFRNAFTREDFYHQLEGLRYFDSKYKLGFMDMEEFIVICEEMADMIENCPDIKSKSSTDDAEPDEDKPRNGRAPIKSAVGRHDSGRSRHDIASMSNEDGAVPSGEDIADDGLDDMNLDELKDFINAKGLDIAVKPLHTKAKIIRDIRSVLLPEPEDDLPFKGADDDAGRSETSSAKTSGSDRLAELKKRREAGGRK